MNPDLLTIQIDAASRSSFDVTRKGELFNLKEDAWTVKILFPTGSAILAGGTSKVEALDGAIARAEALLAGLKKERGNA